MRLTGLAWIAAAAVIGGGFGVTAHAWGLRPVHVTSDSMATAVKQGDWVAVSALEGGGRGAVERGDIVEFRYPLGTDGRAIKRVVAVGGDRVLVTDHSLTVNGRAKPIAGTPNPGRHEAVTVPPGNVFLLGDNAELSIDSRAFGPVPARDLVGRVRFVLPGWGTLELAAAGLIAAVIAIAASQLQVDLSSAYRKLDIASRAQLGRRR